MAFQFDISLGREVEFYQRVNLSDPTNAGLVVSVHKSPAPAASALRGAATLAALLALAAEVTNTDYTRKVLTDADLADIVVDTTNHRITLVLPLLTWDAGGGPNAGDAWDLCVVSYDSDTTVGADSAIVPITAHEMRIDGVAIVPNGSPIVYDLTDGFVVARPS